MDITGVHQGVVVTAAAAAGPSAGAGDAVDGRGLAIGMLLVGDIAAYLIGVRIVYLRCERSVVIHGADAGTVGVYCPLDALDDTAVLILHRIVRNGYLGIIRMLICLDVSRAADRIDHAVIHQSITVACTSGGVQGINLTVGDRANGGTVLFFFLIIVDTCIAAGGRVHLLPYIRIIPPVIVIDYGITLDVAL